MSVTLEELLESSGISEEKTASDNAQKEDLVSALRKMAEAQPTPEDTKKLAAQELTEKTAEIAVIAQTLSEIEKVASLGSQKEPKGHQKLATFIKVAIDEGYSDTEIALFLKESGRIGRAISSAAQAIRRPVGRVSGGIQGAVLDAEERLLRKKLVSGSPKEVKKHMEMMVGEYGKHPTIATLSKLQDEGIYLPYEAKKLLPKGHGKSVSLRLPGGSEKEVSVENLKRFGIPGAAAAGGLALGASSKKDRGGGGVTVVRN